MTTLPARAAKQAMKPESRPMSFTRPMPLRRAVGLDVGAGDRLDRLGEGGLEAEAFVEEHDVVVDGLRDADDALGLAAPARPRG